MAPVDSNRTRIYSVVALIPSGNVATYGDVARLAGLPGHARQVGYALAALHGESDVPWHRVINARGEVSERSRTGDAARQRALLEQEGIRFGMDGKVALERFRWQPDRGD